MNNDTYVSLEREIETKKVLDLYNQGLIDKTAYDTAMEWINYHMV